MAKVLIIRLGAMGDICMAVPLVAALQRHCQVHWLVRRAYAAIPRLFAADVGRLIAVPPADSFSPALIDSLRRAHFDAVLDFSHWPLVACLVDQLRDVPLRAVTNDPAQDSLLGIHPVVAPFNRSIPVAPGLHQVEKWSALIRATLGIDLTLHWPLPALRTAPRPLRVFIHPHASKPEKRWPPYRFAHVLATLAADRTLECTINSGSRRELPAALGLWLRLRTHGIQSRVLLLDRSYCRLRDALLQADVAIGCDSGPMHFAALLGIPSLVLYGPYSCSEFGPLWRSVAVSPPPGLPAAGISTAQVLHACHVLTQRFWPALRLAA